MNSSRQKAKRDKNRLADLFSGDWRWSSLSAVVFSASLSLFVFTRFLDFFITPTMNKVVVFICLFVFFLLLSIFFLLPIIYAAAAKGKTLLIILLISLVVTAGLAFLLPEQRFVIRTVHTLEISVPVDSGSVILENLVGPTKASIPWEDVSYDGATHEDSVTLPPGGELSFSREMTGGLSFLLSAPEKDSEAVITWDGAATSVSIPVGEDVNWTTDPTSLGKPSRINQYLFWIVKANEWLCLFMGLTLVLGLITLLFFDHEHRYRVFLPDAQKYFLDYLILGGILLFFAIGIRVIRPDSLTINMVILLPGFFYLLLKIINRIVPSLPIIVFCLIFVVNTIGHWAWFDENLLHVRQMWDRTFNSLATMFYPNDPTVLSLGFYEQLRESDLVVAEGSYFSDERNINRLIRINYQEHVYVLDYPGELTAEEYERLFKLDGWSAWNRSDDGEFYFYRADLPVVSPIVFFTYGDDILLIPLDQLDELGLFNDFVFD